MQLSVDRTEKSVLKVFLAFINPTSQLRAALDEGAVTEVLLEDDVVRFTIGGLYQLVADQCELSYIQFRAHLYRGTLNKKLAKLGYRIEVHLSTGKVDSNWYQLAKIV